MQATNRSLHPHRLSCRHSRDYFLCAMIVLVLTCSSSLRTGTLLLNCVCTQTSHSRSSVPPPCTCTRRFVGLQRSPAPAMLRASYLMRSVHACVVRRARTSVAMRKLWHSMSSTHTNTTALLTIRIISNVQAHRTTTQPKL